MVYRGQQPVGYQDLARLLRAQIASGELPPGAQLPSETTLAQTYGVASKTARAAIQQLRNEGLAEPRRGRGVVVREPVEPETVYVDPVDAVWARNPTPDERVEYDVPEGVPLIVVIHPDGLQDLHPAHRYRVVIRPS